MTEWSDLSGRLNGRLHAFPIRVYYEDTDFSGVVYHGTYVAYFERARSEFLRLLGIDHFELNNSADGHSLAFAVRRLGLEFHRPATIDDLLEVQTTLSELRGARVRLEQKIFRNGELLVEADVLVVVITLEGKPTRLPSRCRDKLALVAP